MNGIVNVLKPTGMTSSDAVMKVRGIFKEKRVGHLGTLDPMASGVLPITLGKCTRLFDLFLKKDKGYIAFFDFNLTTDTLDSDGVILDYSKKDIKREMLTESISHEIGKIAQLPPDYSAKSIDGKRAYQLARAGEKVELKRSEVEIFSMEILREYAKNAYVLKIFCSSGTYIRSIVRDLAERMGVVGFMSGLIRIQSGNFTIENSVTFDELEKDRDKFLLSPAEALSFLTIIEIEDERVKTRLSNGIKLEVKNDDGDYFLTFGGDFFALGEVKNSMLSIKLNFDN